MPSSNKGRVKLLDIARVSGVSLTAVSLALNEKPGISQETRTRVLEVARSLGYRFKAPVSPTPGKTIKTIGLLVKSDSENEPHANYFYSSVIDGIESACRHMGIDLMFANVPVDSDNCPFSIPPLLEKGNVDGILLTGTMVNDDLCQVLDRLPCPLVLIDSYTSRGTYNSVLSDNIEGAYRATEYLIGKGHQHIGFVGGSDQAYPSFRDRRTGFRQAMASHQLDSAYFADCATNRSDVASAAVQMIRGNREITAIIGANDETAIYAMLALIEAGFHIPQDISVIGYDDIPLAETMVPNLTTMRVHKQAMGRFAVQLLLSQVANPPENGYVTSILRPVLIERSSTGRAAQYGNVEGASSAAGMVAAESVHHLGSGRAD